MVNIYDGYAYECVDGHLVLQSTLENAAKAGMKAIYDNLPLEDCRIDVAEMVLDVCKNKILAAQKQCITTSALQFLE